MSVNKQSDSSSVSEEKDELCKNVKKHIKQSDKRKEQYPVPRNYDAFDSSRKDGNMDMSIGWDQLLRSGKIIVLDFWTFSCVNCMVWTFA